MSALVDDLRQLFESDEARYGYVESFLNTFIASQIKVLREQRKMTQEQLAEAIGTKQSGISRLENANYSSWKVETLRKLGRAFGVRLRMSFEEFGTVIPEIENFREAVLRRRKFEDDPVFKVEQLADATVDSVATDARRQVQRALTQVPSELVVTEQRLRLEPMTKAWAPTLSQRSATLEGLNESVEQLLASMAQVGKAWPPQYEGALRQAYEAGAARWEECEYATLQADARSAPRGQTDRARDVIPFPSNLGAPSYAQIVPKPVTGGAIGIAKPA